MTSQPAAGRPTDRVRLGIAGLGVVAQAVHLPLIERLREAYAIAAIADLSPTLTDEPNVSRIGSLAAEAAKKEVRK